MGYLRQFRNFFFSHNLHKVLKKLKIFAGPYIKSSSSDPDLQELVKTLVTLDNRLNSHTEIQMRFNVLSFLRNVMFVAGLDGGIHSALLQLSKQELDSQNSKKETALHIAVMKSDKQAVKALLDHNASTDVKDEVERTPLHCANLKGDAAVVHELLKAKAGVQSLDRDGKSCLDCAIDSKNSRCIAMLKLIGADGWTPLMVSAENGAYLLKEYLKVRENCLAVRERSNFRDSVLQEVLFFSNLSECNSEKFPLTWESFSTTMDIDDENTMARSPKNSEYSYALGKELRKGLHVWQLEIGDFSPPMWVGIAKSVDKECVNPLKSSTKSYIVCFGSDGVHGVGGACPDGKIVSFDALFPDASDRSYGPGQIIEFRLDTFKASLQISIDGIPVVIAYNMDINDIRPYVCASARLDSVTLKTVESRTLTEVDAIISPEELSAGLDNSIWSCELDAALQRQKGIPC